MYIILKNINYYVIYERLLTYFFHSWRTCINKT